MSVGNEKISILLYADDIIMFSDTKEGIQEMLNGVQEYNNLFDVSISEEKSKIMVLNGREQDQEFIWKLGDMELGRTDEYRYLGINVSPRGFEKAKREKFFKCT